MDRFGGLRNGTAPGPGAGGTPGTGWSGNAFRSSNRRYTGLGTGPGWAAARVSPGAGVVLADSDGSGLKRRAMPSAAAFVLALLGAMVVVGEYVGQHPWFEMHGNAGTMRLLGLGSAVFVGLWVARLLLLVGAARNRVWLAALAAPAWVGDRRAVGADSPVLEAVVAATEAGDLDAAQEELTAVRSLLGEVEGVAGGEELRPEARAEREEARKVREDADHLAQVTSATKLTLGVSKAKARGGEGEGTRRRSRWKPRPASRVGFAGRTGRLVGLPIEHGEEICDGSRLGEHYPQVTP